MLGRSLVATRTADDRGAPPDKPGRRQDIQGLRAVAVLVVVAFHADLPVPGGFVGVDVFFVISGFVITAMLQREWQSTGRIAFGRFYLRRFKRLTPALALMVAVTVVGALLLLSPLGPQQVAAKTGVGAMLISANIVIARTTGGYFDPPAAGNPLLHTWSLSVEEQFYLVFPLLLLIGWTVSRARPRLRWVLPVGVVAVSLFSFLLTLDPQHALLGGLPDSLVGFYGPAGRMWEFAVGALLVVALPRLARLPGWVYAAAGLVGGVALVVSLVAISESTEFPGPWTLLPVGATLLLLAAGSRDTVVRRALATRPLVVVGDWSYSIYLWHWPLIVFATVLWPANHGAVLAAAALSFIPAVVSYRWLETPIRRIGPLPRLRTAGLVAVVVVPVLALSGGVVRASNTTSKTLADDDGSNSAYQGEIAWKDHDYRFGGFNDCTDPALRQMAEHAVDYVPRCQQSKPGTDVDFAIIGDSHAEHLFMGLMDAMPERNVMYFTSTTALAAGDPLFGPAIDYAARTPSIDTVMIGGFWHLRGVHPAALEGLLRPLLDRGKTIVLTDDVPDFPFNPYGCKYRSSPLVPTTCSMSRSDFLKGHQKVVDDLARIQRDFPQVRVLDTAKYLCDDDTCSMTHGRNILYADPNHLNVLGSHYVAAHLVADHPELRDPR